MKVFFTQTVLICEYEIGKLLRTSNITVQNFHTNIVTNDIILVGMMGSLKIN